MLEASPQEIAPAIPNSLEALRAGRQQLSERAADGELHRAVMPHQNLITAVSCNGFPSISGRLTPSSLLAFEALGEQADKVIAGASDANSNEAKKIISREVSDSRLEVDFRNGILMTTLTPLYGSTKNQPSPYVAAQLEERLVRSPGHRELAKLRQQMGNGRSLPDRLTTDPFDPAEDPLGTLVFLSDVGFTFNENRQGEDLQAGLNVNDLLKKSLDVPPRRDLQRYDDARGTHYVWGDHASRMLSIDKASGKLTYEVRKNPWANYLEKADQGTVEGTPFIETECAAALCEKLDEVGLMFHPRLQAVMMSTNHADRFGASYTEITSTIAKWVNEPDEVKIADLFVPTDPEFMGEAIAEEETYNYTNPAIYNYREKVREIGLERLDAQASEALLNIDQSSINSEAARTVISMTQDVLTRQDQEVPSDLPLTRHQIVMEHGSCFDVTHYYMGAAASHYRENKLKLINVNGMKMLEKPKASGKHTFLSTQPLVFNGVHLPKGALFSQFKDGGWAFLRLTPFAYDKPEDQMAFGAEIDKSLAAQQQIGMKIGEIAMLTLLDSAIDYTRS